MTTGTSIQKCSVAVKGKVILVGSMFAVSEYFTASKRTLADVQRKQIANRPLDATRFGLHLAKNTK